MMVPGNRAAESASGHMYPMELRMVTKGRTRSMTGKALDRQHISGTQCRPLQKMEGLKLHEGILTQKITTKNQQKSGDITKELNMFKKGFGKDGIQNEHLAKQNSDAYLSTCKILRSPAKLMARLASTWK